MSSPSFVPKLLFAVAALAAGVVVAVPASAVESTSELQPQALVRARAIRTDVNARYGRLAGRKLAVTEVTSMGVVESVSLMTDPLDEPRVVPAANGIYFALCSVRVKCPHPGRSASWPATAFRPRREALELAVRAFAETTAELIVVALPTWSPTWVVFDRQELTAEVGTPLRDELAADPRFAGPGLRAVVDELTLGRTYVPLGIVEVAPAHETFVAMSLYRRSRK